MTYHPQWNCPNDELIRLHSSSDDPLVRVLVSRLEKTHDSLAELEAAESEIIQEQADEIDTLNAEIDDLESAVSGSKKALKAVSSTFNTLTRQVKTLREVHNKTD